uniref:Uncharacterized protein n=2 Tax=Brassica oleracea TaxID=3712 RepID=A0A0D3DX91_BRAOL
MNGSCVFLAAQSLCHKLVLSDLIMYGVIDDQGNEKQHSIPYDQKHEDMRMRRSEALEEIKSWGTAMAPGDSYNFCGLATVYKDEI